MASLVLRSEFSRRIHLRRAADSRMRHRLRFGFELLEARITPAPMAPTVTGVSPSSGPAGTSVEVQGTNFSSAEAIYFGTIEATVANITSDTLIVATSPVGGSGTVDVRVMNNVGLSPLNPPNDQYTYTTTTAPTVKGVTPNSGPLTGGTSVTITGTGFTSGSSVAFGTVTATNVTFNSATSLSATSPPGVSAGAVDVRITTAGGTSPINQPADLFTYTSTTAPTVTGVSPNSGPLAGGTSVTITGTGFAAGSSVAFGTVAATSLTFNSATSLSVTSPPGINAGAVDVRVTTAGDTSPINPPADLFTYISMTTPTVTGLSPTFGPAAGGTFVTVSGTNFDDATAVDFGTTPGTNGTVINNNTITVDSPPGMGIVDVTVTTDAGTSPTNPADQFTYLAAPTVTGISPSSGPLAGGTSVTITGTDLLGASAVYFGTTLATSFNVTSSTSITAVSPQGTSLGPVDVTVTTPAGTSPVNQPADQFTYLAAPAVLGISPSSGPSAGGTTVTITGTSFTGASSVAFGTTPAVSFSVVSSTTITAVSPPGAGTVDVIVTTPSGTSTLSPADQFTYTSTTDGPKVTNVVRYGYHAQPTYFVIDFNMPLDRASAQLVSNYSVVAWKIVGLIGQTFPVKSATYNAKSDTVTLAFPRRLLLRKNYTLTINGTTASGVKNINGALLDGANTGQPGSNSVTTISQYNLAGSASQRPVAASLRAKVKGLMTRVKVAFRHGDV
jgi:IPT/TIG domain